jgi:hypothetical protein
MTVYEIVIHGMEFIMRKKIIAGNWKMNMVPSEAVKLVET